MAAIPSVVAHPTRILAGPPSGMTLLAWVGQIKGHPDGRHSVRRCLDGMLEEMSDVGVNPSDRNSSR